MFDGVGIDEGFVEGASVGETDTVACGDKVGTNVDADLGVIVGEVVTTVGGWVLGALVGKTLALQST